ncbi:MAG: O-antigen ligase family protein [Alphaproteobacteria bacterium]|nr:O-antigen ligase family protein [Alphaproteobacteria bacterium]
MLIADKLLLWRASAVLIGLCMPLIIVGKSVLGLVLLLGVMAGLMATKDESLRVTVKLLFNNAVTLLVVAFLLAATAGVLLGPLPLKAMDKWLQLILVALGAGLLFMTLREMPGQALELLLQTLVVGILVLCGLTLLDALTGNVQLATALHGADKATSQYRLNFVSSVLAVLLPFLWARVYQQAREGELLAQRLALPAAALGLFVLFVAGGRAGWVGGLVGLVAFVGLAGRYHGLTVHRRHWAAGLGLVLLALLTYGFANGFEFMLNRVTIVGEAGVERGMLSGRGEVWQAALAQLQAFTPAQWFYGVGVMNYRYLPGAVDLHPHNWPLQLLIETGALGFGIFCSLALLLLYRFWQYGRSNLYGVAAFASVAAFLVTGLANTSIFRWDWLALFAFAAILGYRTGWSRPDQKQRRKALKQA